MNLIIIIILLIMASQDYLSGEVSNYLFIPLLFFINFKLEIFIIFIILLFIYKYLQSYIGGADIKLIFIFLLIFSYTFVAMWLFITSLLALLTRKKQIRLFPFFLIAYLIMIWL